jgi:hypothetical protein
MLKLNQQPISFGIIGPQRLDSLVDSGDELIL